ncbi:ATP-binding cassette domain-containing protein [Melioribacteraceae bacterium 4301-Me]|uniref:ATP-binding cassette domain-containing protein n=1 Tax=Pyranulibacter aquaticus TaxID=3163344 RepID=UPI003598236D
MHTLRLFNIRKVFAKREVVKGINIEIKQGEVVDLPGPNGTGKTTTFQSNKK